MDECVLGSTIARFVAIRIWPLVIGLSLAGIRVRLHDGVELVFKTFDFSLELGVLRLFGIHFSHCWLSYSRLIYIITWSIFVFLLGHWRTFVLITNCLSNFDFLDSWSFFSVRLLLRWLKSLRKLINDINLQDFLLNCRFISALCFLIPECLKFEIFRAL